MAYLLRQGHIAKAKALSMWSSGTFKMAQIYLFGLRYEKSENIKNLMRQLNGHQNNDDLATPVINELSKMVSKIIRRVCHVEQGSIYRYRFFYGF